MSWCLSFDLTEKILLFKWADLMNLTVLADLADLTDLVDWSRTPPSPIYNQKSQCQHQGKQLFLNS